MLIRLLATDFPGTTCGPSRDEPDGYTGIRVGIQVRGKPAEIDDLVEGDASSATWELPCRTAVTPRGIDVTGRHVQGGPGARFIYLSWIYRHRSGEDRLFRRAKLMLSDVPDATMRSAWDSGMLTARIGLTDAKGNPSCAAMRAPEIEWSAG